MSSSQVPSKDVTTCKHEAEFRMLDTLPCPWCVIDELKRGREELQRCLNHYQARFSLITNAWRSGDNSAVLDAVRKHITAKDCEDADRLVRASHEPPAAQDMQCWVEGSKFKWTTDGGGERDATPGEVVMWAEIERLRAAQPPPAVCPTCRGNDREMPCAYPSEGKPGCLRASSPPPVAHSVRYDVNGWLCSVCHGWNDQRNTFCVHPHSAEQLNAPTKGEG